MRGNALFHYAITHWNSTSYCMKSAGLTEHKPKRQTARRIVQAALLLFNRFGEPSIAASPIAADTGGNLHYHYASKEMILEALFAKFEHEIGHTLAAPEGRPVNAEDLWLFLHLTFEIVFKYRFLYRDLNELLSRHRIIETQFQPILTQRLQTAAALLEGLAATGALRAGRAGCQALAGTMIMIATYWLEYRFVRHPRRPPDSGVLAHGIVSVLSLANPYLAPDARAIRAPFATIPGS